MRQADIVVYHYVRELSKSRYPKIKGLDVVRFRAQLEYFKRTHTFIRMEELPAALENRANLPENAVLLTFDDGYLDHYENVFPILDGLGIQGSFFVTCKTLRRETLLDVNKIHLILASASIGRIYEALLRQLNSFRDNAGEYGGGAYVIPENSELIEKYQTPYHYDDAVTGFVKRVLQTVLPERLRALITDRLFREFVGNSLDERVLAREFYCDERQLRTMKKHGMFIGVHGYNHEWLGHMDAGGYERDIDLALGEMDGLGLIDRSAWVMNYPYGSYNDGLIKYITGKGCALGLTTNDGTADLTRDNPLLLPRRDTNEFPLM